MCEKEETLKATMGRFKAFAAAAGVEIEGKDSEVVFSELQNRKIVAKVSHTVGRDNPEQTFAQVDRWLPVGTTNRSPWHMRWKWWRSACRRPPVAR